MTNNDGQMRAFLTTCLLQFCQGSVMVSGMIAPGAPVLQVFSYVVATVVLRLHQCRNVREELLIGGLMLTVGGHWIASLNVDSYSWLVFWYSAVGGLGSGILGSAISRINQYALQDVGILRRAVHTVSPVFFYGLGGFIVGFIYQLGSYNKEMCIFYVGWFVFVCVFLSAFVLVQENILRVAIRPPSEFLIPNKRNLAFFGLTGLFSAFVATTLKLPLHSFIVNGAGRTVSGLTAEIFGFPLAETVTAVIASTVLASLYGKAEESNAMAVVFCLGACIGLLGRNKWASVACMVYGVVFWVGVVVVIPALVQILSAKFLAQLLGGALLLTGAATYQDKR